MMIQTLQGFPSSTCFTNFFLGSSDNPAVSVNVAVETEVPSVNVVVETIVPIVSLASL